MKKAFIGVLGLCLIGIIGAGFIISCSDSDDDSSIDVTSMVVGKKLEEVKEEKKATAANYTFKGLTTSPTGLTIPASKGTGTSGDCKAGTYTIAGATMYLKANDGLRLRTGDIASTLDSINYNGGSTITAGACANPDRYVAFPMTGKGKVTIAFKCILAKSPKVGSTDAIIGLFKEDGTELAEKVLDTTATGIDGEQSFVANINYTGTVRVIFSRTKSGNASVNTGGMDLYSIKVEP